MIIPLSSGYRFRREDAGVSGSYFLLSGDEAERRGLVEAANNEGQVALRGDLDCPSLDQIAALAGKGQRFLESKTWEMARIRIAVRVACEVAGDIFEQFAARRT